MPGAGDLESCAPTPPTVIPVCFPRWTEAPSSPHHAQPPAEGRGWWGLKRPLQFRVSPWQKVNGTLGRDIQCGARLARQGSISTCPSPSAPATIRTGDRDRGELTLFFIGEGPCSPTNLALEAPAGTIREGMQVPGPTSQPALHWFFTWLFTLGCPTRQVVASSWRPRALTASESK